MKFLHLSDLHIGRSIQEQSLLEDQKYMLEKIIELIKEQEIDAVLIAGDVYDRSVPSGEAVNVLDEFLRILIKEIKVKVFIIAGNHDSKERLSFGNKIFENDGLYICGNYEGKIAKYTMEEKNNKINIYMLPYIKPVEVKQYFEEEIESYNEALKLIMEKEDVKEKEINIILSHQFVTAGTFSPETSESETLNLGGTENVDISNYDKFDYVALGHIHGPQRIGRDTARYSGTMLKYSFSEVNHKKSAVILDVKDKKNIDISFEELKPLRDMRVIKGPIEELLKPENYNGTNTEDFMKVILTNEDPIYDAIGQIRKVYPNTLKLDIQNIKTELDLEKNFENLEKIKQKNPLELFNDFYKFQNNLDLNEKQKEILQKIIEG